MKHTVAICITVLLLALGGGYLVQQQLTLQTLIAMSQSAKEAAYFDLEKSKFNFGVMCYTDAKDYLDGKTKAPKWDGDLRVDDSLVFP